MTNNSQARPAAPAKPVERIPPNAPAPDRLRVAAYCRTSTELECQESSISGQRSHYRDRILSRPDWAFAGIYWETASGLRAESRPELQRLLADCAAGRVDLILTKSLSRFSRSAADCLSMIRALTGLGVAVRFEKENLRTDRLDSELLLSILAALAEEESRAISDNLKWGIRKRFAAGTYRGGREPYGYRRSAAGFVPVPEEAEAVRRVFAGLLAGRGAPGVAAELTRAGLPTWSRSRNLPGPADWTAAAVLRVARNPFYTGDCLYQRTYTDERYRQRPNRGELDRYRKPDDHPALVDRGAFADANAMIDRRAAALGVPRTAAGRRNRYPFSGLLRCGLCGGPLYRGGGARPFWFCAGHRRGLCEMGRTDEESLQSCFATLLNRLAFAEARLGLLSELAGRLPEAKPLRAAVLRRGLRAVWEPEDGVLFRELTAGATVWSRERMEFQLRCGLRLTEALCLPAQEGRPTA